MKKAFLALIGAAFLIAACTSTSTKDSQTKTESGTTTEEVSGVANITINGDDNMKFDLTEMRVKEGQTVRLTLNHIGKQPKEAMGHNVVILAAGVSLQDFAMEAINAADNDYIPVSMENDVIAHTKNIGGGETTTIEFEAPAKGTYEFLCSFPGHWATMRGKFIVE